MSLGNIYFVQHSFSFNLWLNVSLYVIFLLLLLLLWLDYTLPDTDPNHPNNHTFSGFLWEIFKRILVYSISCQSPPTIHPFIHGTILYFMLKVTVNVMDFLVFTQGYALKMRNLNVMGSHKQHNNVFVRSSYSLNALSTIYKDRGYKTKTANY